MPRLFHRALALLLCLLLVQAAAPTRAGVVCVENGRVVGRCSMVSIPERALESPRPREAATARMACCRPHVAKPKASVMPADSCPNDKRTRCAYAYRSGLPAVSGGKTPRLEIPRLALVAALPPTFALPTFEILAEPRGAAFAGDSDPPRSWPRTPDRGRAPPAP